MGERGKAGSGAGWSGRQRAGYRPCVPLLCCVPLCHLMSLNPRTCSSVFCLPIRGLETHTSWDAAKQLSLTLLTKQPQLDLWPNKRGA